MYYHGFFAKFAPKYVSFLLPECSAQETGLIENEDEKQKRTKCISIGRPGGMEQLQLIYLKEDVVTVGYNLKAFCLPPFTPNLKSSTIPFDCVVLKNDYFSVNYADVTIRWGLYESAKQFVGYPIVPGFDVAGTIERVGTENDDGNSKSNFRVGDKVFGCTLFGAYSSRILIPSVQLRHLPDGISMAQAAALPSVSLTALYALQLAGAFPTLASYSNKAVLIHSCAGGVGSMLVQMSKILGLGPIVGVVGSSHKVEAAKKLGCDHVIDKSSCKDLFAEAEEISPTGYSAVFDANGVSTLQSSYDHLTPTGRLIVYGFHSNLPLGKSMLSPFQWLSMGTKMSKMPRFDPMDMTVSNKCVMGFNLSFFANEVELVSKLFDQIITWLEEKKLVCPNVLEMVGMDQISKAHECIQSGQSIGKIVINTM